MRIGTTALVALAVAASGGPIQFRDVSATSGIEVRLEHSPTERKHLVETMPGGIAAFDYNGDGRVDLFFTNGADLPSLEKTGPKFWNRLYRNEGGFRFTDVTVDAGATGVGFSMGATPADFDNDGDVDLFVAGYARHQLLRNTGAGRFEDVTAAAGIRSAVWAITGVWLDYDRDGRLDLFVVNYLQWSPAFDRYCGDRARGLRVYCHPRFFEGLPNTLYRNRGDGTFEDVSEKAGLGAHVGKGMSAATADVDADGLPDVFVTNDGVPSFLFRNRGDGTFEETGLLAGVALPAHGRPISAMGADLQDVDNDGRPDAIVTALAGETFPFFRNEGKGTFKDATYASGLGPLSISRSGWGVSFADFDNDGWKDLLTANSHVNDRVHEFESSRYELASSVFRNTKGRFEDESASAGDPLAVARPWRGLVVTDLDADGRLDAVVSALGHRPAVWQNVSPGGAHWLGVRLVGHRSNRDGIGATVRIGGQSRVVSSAVGYASGVLAPAHFGVGRSTVTPRVEVRWPSGSVQAVENVQADRVITIGEQ